MAAAVKARVDFLVTWDRKHFLEVPQVTEKSGLTIVAPDELRTIIVDD